MHQSQHPDNPDLVELPVSSLSIGMYVAQLDRPWLETPFALQGFPIREQGDIDCLRDHCAYVYIDPARQTRVGSYKTRHAAGKANARDKVSMKTEFAQAKVDFETASQTMEKVFQRIHSNRRVDVEVIRNAITPLIDSVFRNREALAALTRMKDKSDYHYQHSISTAVWAAVLGRHLGMDRSALITLAVGTSMMDVGMTTVPDELLNKLGILDDSEVQEIRNHVKRGVNMIRNSGTSDTKILDVLACHHERHDGSGYPLGLKSNQIPPMARIAGLVDSYDAMITDRPHSPGRSSFEAMQEICDLRNILFQDSLVEHFTQTVGMFPTGAIVELNTGEIGVVVQQNSARRLRPRIVIILDQAKQPLPSLKHIDLAQCTSVSDETPTMWIAKEHSLGAFGIQPDRYFL